MVKGEETADKDKVKVKWWDSTRVISRHRPCTAKAKKDGESNAGRCREQGWFTGSVYPMASLFWL
jgi:hypothetical protein